LRQCVSRIQQARHLAGVMGHQPAAGAVESPALTRALGRLGGRWEVDQGGRQGWVLVKHDAWV
jgi:hypothetical protein